MALQGLSASLAVLLLYTYPVMVAAFAWVFWGDRVPWGRRPAIPLTLIGMALLVSGEFSADRFSSILLGLGSAVFYSGYILASSRLLKHTAPLVSVTYILSFAGLALGALHFRDLGHLAGMAARSWPLIVAMVGVSTVGAMTLFLAGLQKLHPWEASLLSTLEPVTGVALAALFLGERLSGLQWLGAAGVLSGLVLVSLPLPAAPSGG
jgi:drug/metabolite transporter (DMT)-like permease